MPEASHLTIPLISLEQVGKTYADGKVQALQNLSLAVAAGEFLTIVGKSGCGKSTLLNLMGGLDTPTVGRVLYQGETLVGDKKLDRFRAQKVGFVFQSFYLLPNLTALENVQIPMFEGEVPRAARTKLAAELLGLVGLQDRWQHLPSQLSIGQRQRVAIARALANSPELILADEPTGSLDSVSGREVFDLLLHIRESQACTLVIVTHDPTIAAEGERLVRLEDGRIVEDCRQALSKAKTGPRGPTNAS